MHVAIIWHSVYPWDVRIEKFLNLLTKRNIKVDLLCKGQPSLQNYDSTETVQVHRVFPRLRLFPALLSRLLSYPAFLNPIWINSILRFVRRTRPDLIIVRDLPLALPVAIIGRWFNISVILDMAENYPAALVAYSKLRYKPFLMNDAYLARIYERYSLRYVDYVVVVAEEQRDRLINLGICQDRIFCVRNTPDLALFERGGNEVPKDAATNDQGPQLLYVGKLDKHRGIDTVLRALPRLISCFPNLQLRLVGDGTERKNLVALVAKLGLDENVTFYGWRNISALPQVMRESTICLIPHLKSKHTDSTIPNKLFDYMASEKPVLASNCTPLERIIRDERCGEIFTSGDPTDLGLKAIRLLSDRNLTTYGLNGRKAVVRLYNWAHDSTTLLTALDAIKLRQNHLTHPKRADDRIP